MSRRFQLMRRRGEFEKRGGRKAVIAVTPQLEDNFARVVSDHTAGDPMDVDLVWTYLSPSEISERLGRLGTPVSPTTVRRLLRAFGFSRRRPEKRKTMGRSPHRDQQFQIIAALKSEYLASANPIISMDTKKKEFLGEFSRPGTAYGNQSHRVWDHDFNSFATGKVIPHGLYDLKRNRGHLTFGTSHDTSQFACASFLLWWRRHGRDAYPKAESILLLCDGGGSNNWRHHIFKEDLQGLVNKIDVPIRVAHYPPHCSKYNPIEHRLFPHVTRAWAGLVFRTLDIVVKCAKRTWTRTGLKLTTAVLGKAYELQRKASDRFMKAYPIEFEDPLPDWNYTVRPANY